MRFLEILLSEIMKITKIWDMYFIKIHHVYADLLKLILRDKNIEYNNVPDVIAQCSCLKNIINKQNIFKFPPADYSYIHTFRHRSLLIRKNVKNMLTSLIKTFKYKLSPVCLWARASLQMRRDGGPRPKRKHCCSLPATNRGSTSRQIAARPRSVCPCHYLIVDLWETMPLVDRGLIDFGECLRNVFTNIKSDKVSITKKRIHIGMRYEKHLIGYLYSVL